MYMHAAQEQKPEKLLSKPKLLKYFDLWVEVSMVQILLKIQKTFIYVSGISPCSTHPNLNLSF